MMPPSTGIADPSSLSASVAEVGLACTVPVSLDDRGYEGSAVVLLDVVRHVSPTLRTILLVGHDPAVPELAPMLAKADPPALAGAEDDTPSSALFDRMQAKFPTPAVAVLESRELCGGEPARSAAR
jgi:phosphohistidine phosphatase SixA